MTFAKELFDPASTVDAVVRILPHERIDFLASALRSETVRALAIDSLVATDAQTLRSAIVSGLGFADDYGSTWDSLADTFYELGNTGVDAVLLVVEDAVNLLADHPADREIFLSLVRDLLDKHRQSAAPHSPVLLRLVDLAESESQFGGVSISLSIQLQEPLASEPEVLAGARGRNPHNYGFTHHVHDIERPSALVNAFLRTHLSALDEGGIDAAWIRDHAGTARAYASLHPGVRTPSLALDADVVEGLTRLERSTLTSSSSTLLGR